MVIVYRPLVNWLVEAEGWLLAEVGRGSFVRNRKPLEIDWSRLMAPTAPFRNPSLPLVPISFAHSRPSEDLFPVDAFRQSAEAVLRGPGLSSILQLGAPAGYEPLRRYLLEQARAEEALARENSLMQALMDMAAKQNDPRGVRKLARAGHGP